MKLIIASLFIAIAGIALWSSQETHAATTAGSDTVVNIEKHSNPNGDRFVVVRPEALRQPIYGIWVTEACALSLHLGDDWPSSSVACQ